MKGYVRKIDLVKRNKKDGGTFNQVVFTVDVVINEEKGTIKTRKAYMSEQYASEYAKVCNLTSAEMIGKEVSVSLEKKIYKDDNVVKTVENIKYLNFYDENGNIIVINKQEKKLGF